MVCEPLVHGTERMLILGPGGRCQRSVEIDGDIAAERLLENRDPARLEDSMDFPERPLGVQMVDDAASKDQIEGVFVVSRRVGITDGETGIAQAKRGGPFSGLADRDIGDVYSVYARSPRRQLDGMSARGTAVFKDPSARGGCVDHFAEIPIAVTDRPVVFFLSDAGFACEPFVVELSLPLKQRVLS